MKPLTPEEQTAEAKQRAAIVEMLQTAAADHFGGLLRGDALDRCESLVERIFFSWWVGLMVAYRGVALRRLDDDFRFPTICPYAQYDIECGGGQVYRADFAIGQCVIEIDGHVFHERTAEQVMARNRRDEHLQRAGWSILHCSARELLNNPRAAVMRIARAVIEIEEQRRAIAYNAVRYARD
jgi:hypothetical protein